MGFDAVAKQTTIRTEVLAGIVTFLAMAYILTVNPNQIFGEGSSYWASVFIATALGAVIGTLLMAFLAKMPLAQASGMGLNSMLGGIIGGWGGYGKFTPGQAFMLVLISGLIFLLLSIISIKGKTFRELVFDGMPVAVRSAISVGIGLFIAYIGLQNAGIIVTNDYTQVGFVDFTNWGDQAVNTLVPGWAAAKTAVLFFLSMFALPLFAAIPGAAAASALIYVGVLMMKGNFKSVDMSDAINATSAFLTIVIMVLSYSITKGIGVGMISFTLMSAIEYVISLVKYAITKKEKPEWKVSIITVIVAVLFCVYFFVPATAF